MRGDPRAVRERTKALLRGLLVSPRLPLLLALLVVSLGLPSLERGFGGDDCMQRVWLLGRDRYPQLDPGYFRAWPMVDMHVSVEGDPQSKARLMDLGVLPWWTTPDLRIAALRLFTSFTHWLDYRLWPDIPALMHAHSLLWAALGVAAATFLYRQVLGPASPVLAGLAACLFAVDSAHGAPSYALAYRNGLVALFFCLLTLLAHLRLRQDGWKPGIVLAPALFAVTLLSAEVGVATLAYLFAYAVFLDRGTPRDRGRTLLPYLGVVLVWQFLYSRMGYGVVGSDAYMNPPAEPVRFLGALVERVPSYLLGQWIDLDLAMALLGMGRKLWLAGLAASIVVGTFLLPLLRRDATARFWASGMLLCLMPICALPPAARRLLFAGIGAAGLMAALLVSALRPPAAMPRPWRAALGLVCVVLAASRLVLGPALLFAKALPNLGGRSYFEMPLDYTVETQTLVVLNPQTALMLMALPYFHAVEGRAVPLRTRGLAASRASGSATRTDEHTLAVRVKGGYLTELDDTLFREPSRSLRAGDRIEIQGLTVEVVTSKEDGRPWEVRFRFDVPLEHPSLRWVQWTGRAYAPFRPPEVGRVVEFTPAGAEPPRPGP